MKETSMFVRELTAEDIEPLIQYWLKEDDAFWLGMGVDTSKIPPYGIWKEMLTEQLQQPYHEKQSYCMIWVLNNEPIGHSNVNRIEFGKEAYMHLHIWKPDKRQKGCGLELVKMTIPYFFKNIQLQTLYCEPYAYNEAPNKTLQKLGFELVQQHKTIPGWICFEQEVNLWKLEKEQFQKVFSNI